MKKLLTALAAGLIASTPVFADEEPAPILSVADYDGNGIVNLWDLTKIQTAVWSGKYIAFYDQNADGALNQADVSLAQSQLWSPSTTFDQEMADLFGRMGHLQGKDRAWAQLVGWSLFAPPLAGHGEHWVRQLLSMDAYEPDGQANFYQPMGLNMATEGRDEVVGLYWGEAATPIFYTSADDANGDGILQMEEMSGITASDWPDGEQWKDLRVASFGDSPPTFTSSPDENWHMHPGLCLTTDPDTDEFIINQHLSFNECQALPNSNPQLIGFDGLTPIFINISVNTWMVHMWMFDLNPHGFFANTHPDVDPNAASEDIINGGRPVPHFFAGHHH